MVLETLQSQDVFIKCAVVCMRGRVNTVTGCVERLRQCSEFAFIRVNIDRENIHGLSGGVDVVNQSHLTQRVFFGNMVASGS